MKKEDVPLLLLISTSLLRASTSGTGLPVLCVIILKSDKKVEEIPLTWKWGIDIIKLIDN